MRHCASVDGKWNALFPRVAASTRLPFDSSAQRWVKADKHRSFASIVRNADARCRMAKTLGEARRTRGRRTRCCTAKNPAFLLKDIVFLVDFTVTIIQISDHFDNCNCNKFCS